VLNDLTFYARQGVIPVARLQWFYEQLTPENKASLEGESIAWAIDPPHVPQVGEPFGDIAGTDTTGQACKLSDYAGKGKYVLLDFWSVGCGPCHAAFPQMKEIYRKYGDRLEIVGVSLDANKDQWRDVVQWKELPWKHISDGKGNFGGAYMLYRIEAMPTYVLIDPQGRIVERWYPGQGDFQSRMIEPYLDKQS
ncbi:MAG: TlpA family protein disulfide reductase, partial [Rikenellaceae bacterium]|nr:TlpA family protein disulfide reductase [Rikenellaceae bacterium]